MRRENTAMRGLIIAAAIFASAVATAIKGDEQVVTVRLTPDPAITAHMARIKGPERSLWVLMSSADSSQSKRQKVAVEGTVKESDVSALVHSVLDVGEDYWVSGTTWAVSIKGDDKYAIVSTAMGCGYLCGGGASYTFAFKDGKWNFEYTSDQWIS